MSIRVKPDLLKDCKAVNTLNGYSLTRKFQVSGLRQFDPWMVVPQAFIAVDSVDPSIKVPQPLEPFPDAALSNAIVMDRQSDTDPSFDVVDVKVTYTWRRFAADYLKSVNGTLRQVDWPVFDRNGSLSSVTYTPTGSTSSITKYPTYNRMILNGTISFRFYENFDPEYFNLTYAGAVNSTAWRGYAARTMMLFPVVGTSQDNFWYLNNYTLAYRQETWDEYAFFHDEYGQIPSDVTSNVTMSGTTSGNGWKRTRVQPEYDFNSLLAKFGTAAPSTNGVIPAFVS